MAGYNQELIYRVWPFRSWRRALPASLTARWSSSRRYRPLCWQMQPSVLLCNLVTTQLQQGEHPIFSCLHLIPLVRRSHLWLGPACHWVVWTTSSIRIKALVARLKRVCLIRNSIRVTHSWKCNWFRKKMQRQRNLPQLSLSKSPSKTWKTMTLLLCKTSRPIMSNKYSKAKSQMN